MPAVMFSEVSKRFGTFDALKKVSFTVQQGELMALLGMNGAGKSTAISLMLGLRTPSQGKVEILGHNPRAAQNRKTIGVMLQDVDFPATLTVREALELFRSVHAKPLSVAELVQYASIEDLLKKQCGALSGGEKKRLAFAVALSGNPQVLFLDEPTAAMDVNARHAFWQKVAHLKQQGKTIILTTHYLEEADALADKVVLIHAGRKISEGTPADFKAQVAGSVMRFVGEVPPKVMALLSVQENRYHEGKTELLCHDVEQTLKTLFAHHVPLKELEIQPASLEQAFIHLTRDQRKA